MRRLDRIEQATLDNVVYERLRHAILQPDVSWAGQRIDEKALAEELGVSRTPVREAIRRLESDGLVVRKGRRGVFVADLSEEDVSDLYNVREAIEGQAASLAATHHSSEEIAALKQVYEQYCAAVAAGDPAEILRHDIEFHNLVAQASRSARLQAASRMFRDQLTLLRHRSVLVSGRSRRSQVEMGAVLEAIERRDADGAERAMRQHMRHARSDVLQAAAGQASADLTA